jgi:anthranilate phosphoribosyltransferase
MANPGRVKRHLIGVANPGVAERMLASLRLHGSHRAWVVHGNGLDELTTTGPSTVLALDDDSVRSFTIDPLSLGLAPAIMDELVGGTPDVNAEVVRRVMGGEHGAHRNIVLLNAAAALVVADVVDSIEEGLVVAGVAIDSGAAAATLARFVEVSQQAAEEFGH